MQKQITGQREPLVAVTEEIDLGVIVDCHTYLTEKRNKNKCIK